MLNYIKNFRSTDLASRPDKNSPAGKASAGTFDIVAHVGAPKTGTSAIQYFLVSNRLLLEEYGYYYPEHALDANAVSGGHCEIGQAINEGKPDVAENILSRHLSESKSKGLTLLLSAESLYKNADHFVGLTAGLRLRAIAYFRDPLESMLSNYNQVVKRHFGTNRFGRYARSILRSEARLLSGASLAEWREGLGTGNFTVAAYDPDSFATDRIERQFLRLLGIPEDDLGRFSYADRKINASYTQSALELKRLLNAVLDRNESYLNAEIDRRLQAYSDTSTEPRPALRTLLHPDELRQLREKFLAACDEIRHRFFSDAKPGFLDYQQERETDRTIFDLAKPTYALDYVLAAAFEGHDEVLDYMRCCLTARLAQPPVTYPVARLAELFGYEAELPSPGKSLITEKQVDTIVAEGTEAPDILRELALALESAGEYRHAYRVISRAVALRPRGAGILRIYERLKERAGIRGKCP